MKLQYCSVILLCLTLLLTGCAELTTTVINQLQPTPEATVAAAASAPVGASEAVVPTPTPVGGGGYRTLTFRLQSWLRYTTDIYQINPMVPAWAA